MTFWWITKKQNVKAGTFSHKKLFISLIIEVHSMKQHQWFRHPYEHISSLCWDTQWWENWRPVSTEPFWLGPSPHPAWTCSEAPAAAAARRRTSWFTLNLAVIQKVNRADLACWMTILQLGFGRRERQWHDGRKAKQGVEAKNCCIVNRLRFKEGPDGRRREVENEDRSDEALQVKVLLRLQQENVPSSGKRKKKRSKTRTYLWDCEERRAICLLMVSKINPISDFLRRLFFPFEKISQVLLKLNRASKAVLFSVCSFYKLQTCRGFKAGEQNRKKFWVQTKERLV